MNKYQKAIKVVDTLLHLMCGEEREDGTLVDENGQAILVDWAYEVEKGEVGKDWTYKVKS